MSSGFAFRQPGPKRSAAWYFQQRRQRRDQRMGYEGHPLRVEQIGDRDNLYRCYQELRRKGGDAAGIDGVHPSDLTASEAGVYMGVLSKCVLNGSYRPQPVRSVAIPKPGTPEHRVLKIGVGGDRVVSKALHDAFAPFWEKQFLPCSYGFRVGHSTWQLLADLEVRMKKCKRWVLASADIRKAFDNVPVDEVVTLHEKALARIKQKNFTATDKARTLTLVEKVLRGHDSNKTRGIDQGSPYSPDALNVLLHYKLDVPITRHVGTKPLYVRYADNLAFLAKSVTEGGRLLNKAAQLLQPLGMNLKEEAEVVDLSTGNEAHLLGFLLRQDGDRISYEIGSAAWGHLHQQLDDVHDEPDPPTAARQTVLGWIDALGPAYESGDVAEVLSIMTQHGFREISSHDVKVQWQESWKRWRTCQRHAQRRHRRRA